MKWFQKKEKKQPKETEENRFIIYGKGVGEKRKGRKIKFSTQLTALLLLTALVPILISSIFVYQKVKNQLLEDTERQTSLYLEKNVDKIAFQIDSALLLLEQTGNMKSVKELQGALKSGTEKNQEWLEVQNTIEDIVSHSGGLYRKVIVTDYLGNIITEASNGVIEKNLMSVAFKDYFKALKKGDYFVGDLVGEDGKKTVPLSKALYDDAGSFSGSIVVFLNYDFLFQEISLQKEEWFHLLVLDSADWIVYYPKEEVIGTVWSEEKLGERPIMNVAGIHMQQGKIEGKEAFLYTMGIDKTRWKMTLYADPKHIYKQVETFQRFFAMILLICAVLSVILAAVASKFFSKPLKDLAKVFAHLQRGDLTKRAQLGNSAEMEKVASSLNETLEKWEEVIEDGKTLSEKTLDSADELETISKGTFRFTETLSHILESIQLQSDSQLELVFDSNKRLSALGECAKKTKSLAKEIQESSEKSNNRSVEGKGELLRYKEFCRESKEAYEILVSEIQLLLRQLESISKVNQTINQISKRTNMVSLNAAIEAARAGEAGKGFSVVAEEIRSLSDLVSKACSDTDSLIEELRGRADATGEIIERHDRSLIEQNRSLCSVEEKLEKINNAVLEVKEKTNEIWASSLEVSQVQSDVEENMERVRADSEETLQALSEATSSAKVYFKEVESVGMMISRLRGFSESLKLQLDGFVTRERIEEIPLMEEAFVEEEIQKVG